MKGEVSRSLLERVDVEKLISGTSERALFLAGGTRDSFSSAAVLFFSKGQGGHAKWIQTQKNAKIPPSAFFEEPLLTVQQSL